MIDNSILSNIHGASSSDEQETTVCIDYTTKRANIYSSKSSTIDMLKEWIQNYPNEAICLHADEYGLEVNVPMKWVKLRAPKERSEKWKTEARERLEKARQKRGEELH